MNLGKHLLDDVDLSGETEFLNYLIERRKCDFP